MNRTTREHILTFALLAATLAVTFYPVLFAGRTLLPTDLIDTMTLPNSQTYGHPQAANSYISDGLLQFYPYKLMLRDAWEHGRFAFWNPLNFCGYPAYAETMAANFDLLNIVLLIFPFPLAFHIYIILPLLIAGMGFYLFLSSYKIDFWIARIFATSYMLCGLFITHLLPHFIPGSMCWAPFVCYFIKRYYDSGNRTVIAFAGISLCLGFLGGNLQTALFLVILVTIYGLSYHPEVRIAFPRRAILLSSTISIGLLLSAIMWLPTLELFWNVLHSGIISSTSYMRSYSLLQRVLSIPMLLTFFIPYIAGGAREISGYVTLGVYVIDFNAAIGYIPLLLGFWAIFVLRREPDITPFLWMVALGFLLPIATPLFPFLYHRFFIVAIFGLCAAGALGMQHALEDMPAHDSAKTWIRRSLYLFVPVAGIILIVGLLILTNYRRAMELATKYILPKFEHISFSEGNHSWVADRIRATVDNYSLASPKMLLTLTSIAIGYYIIRILFRGPGKSRNIKLASIWLIATFQVGMFAFTWLPHIDLAKYPLLPRTEVTDFLRQHSSTRVFVCRQLHENEQYLLIDNQNSAYGIADLSGFESLLIRSYYLRMPGGISDSTMPGHFLGLLNVKYILSGKSSHLPTGQFQLIDSGNCKLWENKTAAQRVWISSQEVTVPNDSAAVAKFEDTSYNPCVVIFSDEKHRPLPIAPEQSTSPEQPISNATIIEDKPESISIEAYTDHPGYLVLSDTYYPGWKCLVDGREREIYRANYAMCAVYLEPGRHNVKFIFDPITFRIGAWISLISLTGVLSFVIVMVVSPRSDSKTKLP